MKEGWKTTTLGDVCHVYQPETLSQKQLTPGEFRVYGANGQIGWHNAFNHAAPQLILGCRGSCGTVHFTEPRSWINGNAMVVQPRDGLINIDFLAYAMRGGIDLRDAVSGTAQPQITRTSLTPIGISFPESPTEQRRIVALLDEAFEALATAKGNAEQNLQNTRSLFDSHLDSVFSRQGQDWSASKLGDLSRINYGYTESTSYDKVGPHFLRITDIQDGEVNWNAVPYCRIDPKALPKYKLVDGDIVFARTGATTGKSFLIRNPPESVFASYLIRVQAKEETLIPEFLCLFFQTSTYWDTIRSGMSGSAQGGFNATKLAELIIPFPLAKSEQLRIATETEGIAAEIKHLTSIYERKLAALEELKTSLLHQAFNGEL